MTCPACGAQSVADARFCSACGTRLPSACPSCGQLTQASDRFCAHCGSALRETTPQTAKAGARDSAIGERRHVTVLFSDLVNSTGIAGQLDPEEWRELSADYQRSAAAAVNRYGGHVGKYLGDGLIVYFGFPEAQENGSERAVRAGLAILDAVEALNRRLSGTLPRLSVRIGIHTGEVVIGQDGGGNPEVFGDTTNLAARVQAAAEPDTLFITAPVHDRVSGLFVIEPRGEHRLKGVLEPVELFRVKQASGVRGRIDAAAASSGLAAFVGREEELRLLWRRWELARDGEGQMVVIAGEPGIGKSRLIDEMQSRLTRVPHTWIQCTCDQLLQNTPFHPVSEMLKQAFPWRPNDTVEGHIRDLEEALNIYGLRAAETLPLIAPLLDLPVPSTYPSVLTAPERQHRRVLATLAQWLFGLARAQPVVIAIEDLQWADPSSLELARLLAEQNVSAPVLLLCTTRSEFRVPWPLRAHHSHLMLSPLSRRETRAMIEEVASRARLSNETIDAVVERTGGVPLFVEELTRLMLDSDGRANSRQIPPTLHDSLAARLGRVGSAREIAQIGAVLGREFSYELIRAVSGAPEADLQAALAKLADADLLHARGVPPEALYRFKHALLQDAAYETLLKTRRRELHREVGAVLSRQFKEVAESQPEILARHLTEAWEYEAAVTAWQRAGEIATRRGAFAEAEEHQRRALETFAKQDDAAARGPQELALKGALAITFLATRGWSAPEAKAIFEDALEVGRRFGDPITTTLLLASLFATALTAGEISAATAIASELRTVSERTSSRFAATWANALLSIGHFIMGELDEARICARGAIATYDEEEHRVSPIDPSIVARAQESAVAVISGEIDTGKTAALAMLEFAISRGRLLDIAQARLEAFAIYFHLRDAIAVAVHAKALVEDATQHDLRAYLGWGLIHLGWSLAVTEDAAQGLATLRRGLEVYATAGSRLQINRYLCMLADAQAAVGLIDEALENVDEAMDAAPEQRIEEPFILWKRGELLLAKARASEDRAALQERAEADFRDAMARARAMGARLYELRAANSLARMMIARGEASPARELLQPLFDSFAGAGDCQDLTEARALLKELS